MGLGHKIAIDAAGCILLVASGKGGVGKSTISGKKCIILHSAHYYLNAAHYSEKVVSLFLL